MAKYRAKNPVSPHAYRRMAERYHENIDRLALSRSALHYGVTLWQLPSDSKLRAFMLSKHSMMMKIVKLLNGYVFIFSKGQRLITMYELPEEFKEEWEGFSYIQEQNKKSFKAMKANRKVKKPSNYDRI